MKIDPHVYRKMEDGIRTVFNDNPERMRRELFRLEEIGLTIIAHPQTKNPTLLQRIRWFFGYGINRDDLETVEIEIE